MDDLYGCIDVDAGSEGVDDDPWPTILAITTDVVGCILLYRLHS
jgi:hypothetical protein